MLLERLSQEKQSKMKGGIYHRTQIDFCYNTNHIEGSKLSQEQTRHIFETNTIGGIEQGIRVDDIIETANHFRAFDFMLENALEPLSQEMIKEFHAILKSSTSDSRKDWFAVGDYKKLPNEVGGNPTTAPENVAREMADLLAQYHQKEEKTLRDLVDFHYRFEAIHPFQDGNGRVGRLILFKECLANEIVPFIITEELKFFYYRGLQNWLQVEGYLLDTCLTAQDEYKLLLDYFRVNY
ncbi:hypothetical protein CAPN008_04570 [Capnocytophaga canis]|uniref:Fic family protein n=1 Tax=Capnocytophaga canis TaxID=1848903 RepID=UPI001ACAA4F8|nr:Fic family protein [Capnocytophaga canis]GIM60407.1 hypothetical protein CAPN008_04570 [Capnocytophaga canis]